MKLTIKKLHKLIQEQLLLENQSAIHGLMSDNPKFIMKYVKYLEEKGKVTFQGQEVDIGDGRTMMKVEVTFLDDDILSEIIRLYQQKLEEFRNVRYRFKTFKSRVLHMTWTQEAEVVDDREGPKYVGTRKKGPYVPGAGGEI